MPSQDILEDGVDGITVFWDGSANGMENGEKTKTKRKGGVALSSVLPGSGILDGPMSLRSIAMPTKKLQKNENL